MVKAIAICACELFALIIQIIVKKATHETPPPPYHSLNGCIDLIMLICTMTSDCPIINIIGIVFAIIACYSFYLNDKNK